MYISTDNYDKSLKTLLSFLQENGYAIKDFSHFSSYSRLVFEDKESFGSDIIIRVDDEKSKDCDSSTLTATIEVGTDRKEK